MENRGRATAARWLAWGQGGYFLLTGLWPLVHMDSFLWVTGPKESLWLVQTVGALIVAVAVALLVGAREGPGRVTGVLGASAALALGLVDVVFYLEGVLRWVYLLDAAAEAVVLAGWAATWRGWWYAGAPG